MNSRIGYGHLLVIFCLGCAPLSWAGSIDAKNELAACARIAERDSRVDCYENLGRRVLAEVEAAPVVTSEPNAAMAAGATTAAQPGKPEMNENMGGV